MDDEMVGKNHEHCNDAQQFYAGITPPFEIRVGGTALWEAVVFEPIIISPSFFSSLSNIPLIGDSIHSERPVPKPAYSHRQNRRPR